MHSAFHFSYFKIHFGSLNSVLLILLFRSAIISAHYYEYLRFIKQTTITVITFTRFALMLILMPKIEVYRASTNAMYSNRIHFLYCDCMYLFSIYKNYNASLMFSNKISFPVTHKCYKSFDSFLFYFRSFEYFRFLHLSDLIQRSGTKIPSALGIGP